MTALMGGSFDAGPSVDGKTPYREVAAPRVWLTTKGKIALTVGGVCLLMDHEHSRRLVEALMDVTQFVGEPA